MQGSVKLEVKNFGPIADAKIDLRPLTVFVGPSNTGKSYLAILIYALHRFFSRHLDRLGLPGFRHFPLGYDLFVDDEENQPTKETLDEFLDWAKRTFGDEEALSNEKSILIPDPIAGWVRSALTSLDARGGDLGDEISRCFGVNEAKELIRKGGNARNPQVVLRRGVSDDADPFVQELSIHAQKPVLKTTIPENMPIRLKAADLSLSKFGHSYHRIMRIWDEEPERAARRLIADLSNLAATQVFDPLHLPAFYLPADRTGVMHAHRVVVSALIERATRAGLRQDTPTPMLSGVLADFLEQLIEIDSGPSHPRRRERPYRRKSRRDLGKEIERRILGGEVDVKKTETGYPRFTYRPETWKADLPLMNASSMVAELAPVVLYLRYMVRPDNVLIVEEPESHLHPAMQVKFTRQIAALIRAGVRVLLTTHSEWVLEELANIVQSSKLPKAHRKGIEGGDVDLRPDDVGVWLFQPKNRPRGSIVKEIPLDDSGLFPSGFDDVAVALHNDWADISSRIGEKSG